MMRKSIALLTVLLALLPAAVRSQGRPPGPAEATGLGFYRYPALHGDLVIFAAEGDLWKVPVSGGRAQRLTTHLGEETHPRISPDGRTLAFTARYEGPTELYTMPVEGGLPVRRTYEEDASIATTWMPDGRVVYTTTRFSTLPQPQMVILDLERNALERVPLYTATEGAYDAPSRTWYFVRPAFHNNVTKRYTGGTARNIWKFAEGAPEAVELTGDYNGESHSPMPWGGRVYFVTDRDGTMNLWSMNPEGGDLRQHTFHSGWDVRTPYLHNGRIVYACGADLWLFDIAQNRTSLIPITLSSDFDQLRERWVTNPMEYVTAVHLHPKGESVVLTARGRVFVAPVGRGRLVKASAKQGVRYRDAIFLPDGHTLAALSDETGELEWVTLPATGVGEERRLTNDGTILRFQGHPSPDGKYLAYRDNHRDLWILELATGRQTRLTQDQEGVGAMAWSPDSQWLAYEKTALNSFVQIQLFRPRDGTRAVVTSDRTNSYSPAWHPGGQFLYFLSDRNLQSLVGSPWGPRAPSPYFDRPMEIFLVALKPGLRSPFTPDDELTREAASSGEARPREGAEGSSTSAASRQEGAGRGASGTPAAPRVEIELSGLASRLYKVPVRSGNYSALTVNDGALFFLDRDAGQQGGARLTAIAIGNQKPPELVVVAEGVGSYEMSLDGKKLLLRQGNNLYVADARASRIGNLADFRVDLSGWSFPIQVREDWRQIFVDAWRLERDYFYDPGMHGTDWKGILDKHLPLVDRITTRDELSEVIGWMVGELSALHTSVRGGDLRRGNDNVRVASLGARLLRDPAGGGYRIDYIYRSDPDYPDERSPLADPSLGISEGDIIEQVNGRDVLSVWDIGALLRNEDRQVRLRIRPAGGGPSRDVMVTPTTNESNLRYSDWQYTRRLRVEEASGGQIGYLHLRAMGSANITEFYRNFYPVFNRAGLIIDVRQNRGGNIDSILLEKLLRQAWMYWKGRVGQPTWNMQYAFRGHMVVLVDENTASDGEAFAEGFRRLGLGPVIGTRTWGGEIWLSDVNTLTDGGIARAPQTGVYGPEGQWLIEQIGVIPDIVVDNLPHATFRGQDAQLERAIEYLLEKIAEDPRPVPPPPPYPNRRFDYPTRSGPGGTP